MTDPAVLIALLIGSLLINVVLFLMYFDAKGSSEHIEFIMRQHRTELNELRKQYSESRYKLLQMWEEERRGRAKKDGFS